MKKKINPNKPKKAGPPLSPKDFFDGLKYTNSIISQAYSDIDNLESKHYMLKASHEDLISRFNKLLWLFVLTTLFLLGMNIFIVFNLP